MKTTDARERATNKYDLPHKYEPVEPQSALLRQLQESQGGGGPCKCGAGGPARIHSVEALTHPEVSTAYDDFVIEKATRVSDTTS